MEDVCKIFLTFLKLVQFSFRVTHLLPQYSTLVNNSMSLFVAVMNRMIAEIPLDTIILERQESKFDIIYWNISIIVV
jgi:hypothetical protein